jgi:hypothetical protein
MAIDGRRPPAAQPRLADHRGRAIALEDLAARADDRRA